MKKLLFLFFVTAFTLLGAIAFTTPARAVGVNGNPWGYNFSSVRGTLIYKPDPAFCRYFHCINNFPNGKGYVVECLDGMYSKSGGIRGSCAFHHGNGQILYAHETTVTHPVQSGSSTTKATYPVPPSLPYTGSDPLTKS